MLREPVEGGIGVVHDGVHDKNRRQKRSAVERALTNFEGGQKLLR
jgi:hypothetical protein